MSYQSLLPLVQKTGSPLSLENFQERINIVFHDFEANHYDAMHADMWGSLQEQINLLLTDLFSRRKPKSNELSLLDIGCGTGLSSQILLNSQLGQHIKKVTLLDTSSNMLKYAEQKAKTWGKELTGFELIKMRSYGFYGLLKSDLIDSYKEKEAQFIAENNVNGRNISCIWMKK